MNMICRLCGKSILVGQTITVKSDGHDDGDQYFIHEECELGAERTWRRATGTAWVAGWLVSQVDLFIPKDRQILPHWITDRETLCMTRDEAARVLREMRGGARFKFSDRFEESY